LVKRIWRYFYRGPIGEVGTFLPGSGDHSHPYRAEMLLHHHPEPVGRETGPGYDDVDRPIETLEIGLYDMTV
jgi:hypothetical protein